MKNADDPPVLQFVETIADIGAGDPEGGGDLLRRQRPGRKEKEGMNLGDGAIDSPARPHFAPMENEFLRDGRERVPAHLLFLSKQKLKKMTPRVKKIRSRVAIRPG